MQKNKIKLIFLAILLCVFLGAVKNSQAATYYVDYVGGSDANNGTSTNTPWQHSPGDASATNNPLATILAPGDTVIFKGGVTYAGSASGTLITIGRSGAAGNFITYRGNTAQGDWGTGKAIIDLQYQYFHAFLASAKNYITISNFEIKNLKNNFSSAALTGSCPAGQAKITRGGVDQCVTYSGSGATNDLGAISNAGGGDYWVISDSIFHDTENYTDLCVENAQLDGDESSDFYVPAAQNWIRMRGPGATNIEISNNEFYATGETIIDLYGTDGVTIKNNNFGGINRGSEAGWFSVAVRVEASEATATSYNKNLHVEDNVFHDGWQYGGNDPQRRCHAGDWIHIYGYDTVMNDNIYYERNFWYNDKEFSYNHASAMSQIDHVANMYVWNNVFVNPQAGNGTINFHTAVTNVWFENNTVVVYGRQAGVAVNGMGSGMIRNNICVHYSTAGTDGCFYTSTPTMPAIADNNIYYTPNGASPWRYDAPGYSLSAWQAFSGKDANSSANNPQLVSVPVTGATSSSGNYQLSSSSTNAINQGVTLAGFSDDMIGTLRPQGGTWDIGAYEYVGNDIVAPAAPSGLSVQ